MKKTLLGGFLWRALFFASNLLLNIAFARKFGAEESGTIYTICNSLSFFLLIASINIETGIGYFAAIGKQNNFKQLILWGVSISVFTGILLCLFLFVPLTQPIFKLDNWPVWYSIVYVIGNVLVSIIQVLFFARGNYVVSNIILSVFSIITTTILLLPDFFLEKAQAEKIYFLYPIVPSLVLLTLLINTKPAQTKEKAYRFRLFPIIKYSIVALAGNILFFLLYRIDYWFVQHYTTEKALGNYVQVAKFGQLLLLLPTIFSGIIFPRVADGTIENFKKPAALAFVTIIATAAFSFLIVLLCGRFLFTWLLGKDFSEMYVPTLLKIPAILFLSLQFVLGTWFSGKNKVIYNLYCTIVGVVLVVILDFLLIPILGITGASLASLISYSSVFVTAAFVYQTKTNQNFVSIFQQIIDYILVWRISLKRIKKLLGK